MRPTLSQRRTTVPVPPADAWAVVASGRAGPQWYVDSAPLVFRAAVDRVVGGTGADAPPPGRGLLQPGDDAGFWTVTAADGSRLELVARVRSPGRVALAVEVGPAEELGCSTVTTTVHLAPRGLVGAAYLLADLPAREVVTELVHRRVVADVRRLSPPPAA